MTTLTISRSELFSKAHANARYEKNRETLKWNRKETVEPYRVIFARELKALYEKYSAKNQEAENKATYRFYNQNAGSLYRARLSD